MCKCIHICDIIAAIAELCLFLLCVWPARVQVCQHDIIAAIAKLSLFVFVFGPAHASTCKWLRYHCGGCWIMHAAFVSLFMSCLDLSRHNACAMCIMHYVWTKQPGPHCNVCFYLFKYDVTPFVWVSKQKV
jgi:hypothetical protein